MNEITRTTAQKFGLKRYFTGGPCKQGHVAERYVKGDTCIECASVYAAENKAKIQAAAKIYRAENRDKIQAAGKVYRAENRDKSKAYRIKSRKATRRYYFRNKKRIQARHAANREQNRERQKTYYTENKERYRRLARRHSRTPLGQLRSFISNTARRLELQNLDYSRFTLLGYGSEEYLARLESTLPPEMSRKEAKKLGWQVDHIVPIAFISRAFPLDDEGRILAFQVAQDLKNLRMIPGDENIRKGAKLDLNPEQERVFEYLCEKYDVHDEMIAQAIPY